MEGLANSTSLIADLLVLSVPRDPNLMACNSARGLRASECLALIF